MTEFIKFTRNYSDRSTSQGFQWEFYCERCNNGYRSKFNPSTVGMVTEAMEAASGLLGGLFSRVSDMGNRVQSATWERAHDKAFQEAAAEVSAHFVQCPRCNAWVCRERCWNEDRGLCFDCAPDTTVEAAAAQADAITSQAVDKMRERTYDVSAYTDGGDDKRAACPNCGAALNPGAKFCAECGTRIEEKRYCIECGAELAAKAKFCPECGTKQE
ncbi:MAG: zinc ribbon domain-containing protein [Anaerolineae bacterium]|nr:zinc ribbon domain-containing protein [Anaerolineae bacterium]